MRKAYLIPEETIRKTLPVNFETLIKKLKRKSFMNNIPVVFQIPKDISKDEWIVYVNTKKALDIFGKEEIKRNMQLLTQEDVKFIRIKPNTKLLPFSVKQKLFLGGALLSLIILFIAGYYLALIPFGVISLIIFLNNALIYNNFSWSKTMDINVKLNKDDDTLLEHIRNDSFRGGILGVDGLSPAWDDDL
ncbi:hypothetical protein QI155_10515 [Thermodesulfovibrio sp. 1176]|uniref:hypothetical protein n=1 Tax=Thermodesulfovibrio sp. 1176 TaxID=3043424 RepID=UPI00248273EB|nr:hypothetical protein [Thermodesulfovibrio sp. 1176]MDI1472964.1 hypothetical protein [Thermodesulfovibrio sp. 1176]